MSRHHPRCKGTRVCTFRRAGMSAEIVRAKRWRVGDVIVGREDEHIAVLRITAIGEEDLLAVRLHAGVGRESLWYLSNRCWVRVPAKLSAEYVAGDTAQRSALLPRLVAK